MLLDHRCGGLQVQGRHWCLHLGQPRSLWQCRGAYLRWDRSRQCHWIHPSKLHGCSWCSVSCPNQLSAHHSCHHVTKRQSRVSKFQLSSLWCWRVSVVHTTFNWAGWMALLHSTHRCRNFSHPTLHLLLLLLSLLHVLLRMLRLLRLLELLQTTI